MNYTDADGQWCKVEIMGYVSHIARCKEVPLLDGRALRVSDETEPGVIYYPLGSIFSLRWLTEAEGAKMSAARLAEQVAHEKRVAQGAKIDAIVKAIRAVVANEKLTMDAILLAVVAAVPVVDESDFVDAFERAWLTRIPGANGGPDLWWSDPEECPF